VQQVIAKEKALGSGGDSGVQVCRCFVRCWLLVVVTEEVGNLQGEVLDYAKPRAPRNL
jgi:hypothetical protein